MVFLTDGKIEVFEDVSSVDSTYDGGVRIDCRGGNGREISGWSFVKIEVFP